MTSEGTNFVITIATSQDTEWDGERAVQFMHQMLLGFGSMVYRIIATHQTIRWQVLDVFKIDPKVYENAIRASYPNVDIVIEEMAEVEFNNPYPFYRIVLKYQQVIETFLAPILYATDIRKLDPLAHFTEIMGNLQEGEQIIYYVLVDATAPEAYKEGQKQLTRNIYDGTLTGFVDPYKVDKYRGELTRVCQDKLAQDLYHAAVMIQIDTPDPHRFQTLLMIDNQIVGFDRPQFGQLRFIDDGLTQHLVQDFDTDWESCAMVQYGAIMRAKDGFFRKNPLKRQIDLILDPRELATLWHLPHENFTAPTIQWSYGAVRLPQLLRGKKTGVCLGINRFAGREEPIYIPERSGHITIVGKTGVGKTNLMHHLIDQDIAAGHGVAVIDPHGQLVTDILRYSIPANREKDVVILDLADEAYPMPLNMLTLPVGMDKGNAAGQLLSVLDRLYDFNSTPTVADALAACLVTLLHDHQPTIRDVNKLLRDEPYRQRLMSTVTNVAALEFWERFSEQKSGREQIIRPVLWRLRSLYSNEALYPILCHPDTLDIATLMNQNKILLVSLKTSEARVPLREQHLLGLILLSQLQQNAMIRPTNSPMFYLFVDEVQHFITTTFDTLLSEARKYQLSLTTANQYLRQLSGNMLGSIIGNVGTMVAFQLGLDDARLLEPYFAPGFDAEHLMHLNKYEAAMTTRHHTTVLPAFSLKTLPPLTDKITPSKAAEREKYLRTLSRERYTPKHRQQVLDWLTARYAGVSIPATELADFE